MDLIEPNKIFAHGISPSMVQLWMLCRRKWYNHYIRGMKRVDKKFARFGAGLHAFLEHWHNPNLKTKRDQVDTLIRLWHLWYPKTLDFISPSGTERTQALGDKILKKYVEFYPKESEPFKVITEKREFIVPFSELKCPLHMIIDDLIEYRQGKWILEHKTTSALGVTFLQKFRIDYQNIAYLKGLAQVLGTKIEGVYYNVIGCKKTVDAKNFMRDDEVGCKTQEQIDYHWQAFVKVANEMIEFAEKHWQDAEAFPMSEHSPACQSYMTKCQYSDVCEMCDNTNLFNSEQTEVV